MEPFLSLALPNALGATLLAVLVAILTRFCRRPAVRHALWLLVLLKLVTPPLVPVAFSWPQSAAIEVPPDEVSPAVVEEIPVLAEAQPSTESLPEPEEQPVSSPSEPLPEPSHRADYWLPLGIALWLGGSVLWWMIAGLRLRKFHRLLRQARLAPQEVQEQARRLADRLGLRFCPPVVFVSAPLSPLLWALGFSPRLLVPVTLWHKLTGEQQDTLLAHELAHLRRGDHWVRRLEFVVLGLYWWHPVVWWARRRLQEAEEECCDALVVSLLPDAAPAYASAMVETVAFLAQTRAAALVGASGAGQVPLLKRRLTMILSETPMRRPTRVGFWIVLGLGALLLPLAPGIAQPQANEPEKPRPASDERSLLHPHEDDPQIREHILKATMQSCTACHVAQTVHERQLEKKPKSWREAHDEIIRLMDELRRRQAQFREMTERPQTAAAPDRSEEIEKLKDEVELLKVKVQLTEAYLESAQTQLKEYRKRYQNQLEINRKTPGAIPLDDMEAVRVLAEKGAADAKVKAVEVREAQLRLVQAQRRLARLQGGTESSSRPSAPKPAAEEKGSAPEKPYFHNFGSVKHGSILKHRFPVKNFNQEPIRISNVRTSAGCVTATAAKREIPPGGEAMIDVEIDSARFTGTKAFTVWVNLQEGRWVMPAIFRAVSETQPAEGSTQQDKQAQLKELESKVEKLIKEIRELRREMQPDKPRESEKKP